jgi:hypothetical protein
VSYYRKFLRFGAFATLAVFVAVFVEGIFHNAAVGLIAGIGLATAVWFAAKRFEDTHA